MQPLDVDTIARDLRLFAQERAWQAFHTPKNIATAIAVESGELLELFQWSVGSAGWDELAAPALRHKTAEELADILIYLIRFADLSGIDLRDAVVRKIELNRLKYPADKFKGSDRKYNEESQ